LKELNSILDHRKTISSSNNWLNLKPNIDACSNTKDKGDIFELLVELYLDEGSTPVDRRASKYAY
jgi:hypothetical protein